MLRSYAVLPRKTGTTILVLSRQVHDIVKRPATNEVVVQKGPGGRSSVSGHIATVLGCTGFLGRYVVNNLGKSGTQVVTPYRGTDDDRRHLRLMGDLGQIVPLRFDIRNEDSIRESVRHSDVVYNLIGKDFKTKNFTFEQVHVEGAARIARICKEEGVSKLIHVSALNADENSNSHFLRTKALGEKAVKEEFPDATIVRPGTMYGHEDRFWNRLGWFVKWLPGGIPILNGGKTRIRPTYVGDVAHVLAKLEKDDRAVGKVVELYGPKEYYYASLVEFFLDVTRRDLAAVYVPKFFAKTAAAILDKGMATPIIAPDEVERLYVDDKPTSGALTFADFNVKPHTVEEQIVRFAGLYRAHEYQRAPYETIVRKYTTEDVKL
ncbi:uncharacterized protein SPPG_01186 [Spizellomyces punctatus DAOM BR117]|uniref:NAD-dependent epimerase/dehydratase domain-containing protein n=1 Tax=Spizellomyces punctatus (strain DAOM BR117) TaxID=645134 RepID=A0A0L0HQR5_SPIPD|nr:uncharacterized protein SPPG_01186 [Spizellomyces punctatus DAOM BR117]KND03726.1 hypothetical protein SPPG_01186 [Spizellomyces punctatus DAOM BR117]|eukprot:XP_016611765.1 hypothetical protein SPPG_01186 [Spizellomyces punctatus DAOM BR117]